PVGVADAADVPLHAFHFRFEKTATVTGAFERGRNFPRFQLAQLVKVNLERLLDFAFNAQPPFVSVDLWNREVIPNVKQFRRRDDLAEMLQRRFENEWVLAQHDLSVAKFRLFHRLQSTIGNLNSTVLYRGLSSVGRAPQWH